MKHEVKRALSVVLCFALVAGFFLVGSVTSEDVIRAEATNHGVYGTLASIYDYNSCPSMQGLAVCGDYLYCIKTDGNDYAAVVARVNKKDGSKSWITNTGNSTYYFYDFGHGNDMDVVNVGGVITMFVPTSAKGSGSLVRYSISGTSATKVGNYQMVNTSGSEIGGGALRVVRTDASNIYLLFKSGAVVYTGVLPISQTSGQIVMTKLCTLDYSTAYVNGVATDVSAWSLQGMGYYDHMLYLPLSSHTTTQKNMSIILVYDLEGASGTIKPLPDPTFKITSSAYSAYFEVESCCIDPATNLLYFNANRRVSSSDTNHDAIMYISNWTYEPQNRNSEANNYRWEMVGDRLQSVTDGGAVYNGLAMHEGSVSNGTITNGRYATSKTIVLEAAKPWVLEWKSNGCSAGQLLFATQSVSSYGTPYIFVNGKNARVSIGYHDGSKYNNYGVTLADHGIDGSQPHTFRLTNKPSNGSNMVYLSVDGKELGPMNNYFVASASQGTTSNWVSGQDFRFSYLGTSAHKVNDSIEYIQVWGNGIVEDVADTYRWETSGNALNAVSGGNYTANNATLLWGSVSGTTYSDAQYSLKQNVTLLHDRAWSIEWQGSYSAGTMLLAEDDNAYTEQAAYLYRSGVIAFGYRKNGSFENYGLKLSDYGISYADNHVYRLTNRINEDGSNMVYLYVDGREVGPMNGYYLGTTYQGTTSDWVNGRDFTFTHLGTYNYKVNGSMSYLQVWEGCTHSFGPWQGSNASCTEEGYMTRSCYLCGTTESKTEVAYGHSYEAVVTPPDCTNSGYTTYTCQTCGDSYTSNPVPVGGHVYESVVTAPGCDTIGYTTYTCSVCGHSYIGNSVAATGHKYQTVVTAPTCTQGGYTSYSCLNCGDSFVANQVSALGHNYVEGYCTVCGVKDPDYVALVIPTLSMNYPSLSFEDEILYNVYYSVDNASSIVEMGLATYAYKNANGTVYNAVDVISGYVGSDGTYMVQTKGIPAKNLGDALYFKVYAKLTDGSYVYSEVAGYHAVAYAKSVLNNSGSSAKAKALVVAMLNYGAAAQEYFGYKTNELMNASLNADQQALVQPYNSSMVADVVKASSSKVGAFVMNGGYSSIYPTVSFEGAFSINYYFTPNKTVDGSMTFYYWDSATYNSVSVLTAANATGKITMKQDGSDWGAAVAGIAAKSIDETIYVAAVYTSGGVSYPTNVIAYSLGNYCKTIAANGESFGAATAVYGYYAKAYFA